MTGINDLNNQNKQNPWYAVRTFNCQELKISDFLRERGKVHFIPMTYVEKEREGKMKRMLVPVVHNLIFLQKDESQKATRKRRWTKLFQIEMTFSRRSRIGRVIGHEECTDGPA